ncbi:type VII secretion-associated serine protease mycosin [Solwaraspora sp. WMMB335]|uniref:type VII secretion-associated serine protease mycosin n=1 Tax=Solwaraspora sp. WMMB335 TaxID=3404118 RepID=UPI003B930E3D
MRASTRRKGSASRRRFLLPALAVAISLPAAPAAPAGAAPGSCRSPAASGSVVTEMSWHQRWLSPARIWPLSTGAGVRVAVIDSGVDSDHPQLSGRVAPGVDILGIEADGTVDCVSHGTAVASIIAAGRRQGVGFHGIAPGVTIVPIRVTERVATDADEAGVVGTRLAEAIRLAVDDGAAVINFSVVHHRADEEVRKAVQYASDADVVLVASVGNDHRGGDGPDPTPYPAAFEGVIGVGAIDANGQRWSGSQIGGYVDLVAPGGAVVAATRVAGHTHWDGTSFAAPMVSAAAALLRAAEPELSAPEVARRLIATADPAAGSRASGYGHGVVNPYRAVTERLTSAGPLAVPALPEIAEDPAALARAARWRASSRAAIGIAGGTAVLIGVVVALVVMVPRGRRRRWRPMRRATGAATTAPHGAATGGTSTGAGPADDPADRFFLVPPSAPR